MPWFLVTRGDIGSCEIPRPGTCFCFLLLGKGTHTSTPSQLGFFGWTYGDMKNGTWQSILEGETWGGALLTLKFMWAMKKTAPSCLGYIGGWTPTLAMWGLFHKPTLRIPMKQPEFHGKYLRVFSVAHRFSIVFRLRPGQGEWCEDDRDRWGRGLRCGTAL